MENMEKAKRLMARGVSAKDVGNPQVRRIMQNYQRENYKAQLKEVNALYQEKLAAILQLRRQRARAPGMSRKRSASSSPYKSHSTRRQPITQWQTVIPSPRLPSNSIQRPTYYLAQIRQFGIYRRVWLSTRDHSHSQRCRAIMILRYLSTCHC